MTSGARPPEARIAVFAKAPVAGTVKTRLATLLGPEGAAGLHAGLVRHAISAAVQAQPGAVDLWCSPDESHPFFARCAEKFGVELRRQSGGDLGERMNCAFEQRTPLLLIGSDCPVLGPAHLREAAAALAEYDAVFTPAEDGGYVLVGLAKAVPQLFDGVAWGTAAVMAQTRARIAQHAIRAKELPTLWDVDRPEDYARLQREGLLHEVLS